MTLSAIQKAACEAVWRALQERNHDRTGQLLTRDLPVPVARARIADFVMALPLSHLPKLVLPELSTYGPLAGGYTERWAKVSQAGLAHDARVAAEAARYANQPASQMQTWPPSVSDSSGGDGGSRDNSAQGQPRPPLQYDDEDDESRTMSPGSERPEPKLAPAPRN